MSDARRKCRRYSVEYLSFGFVPSPSNETRPMCLLCEKTLSNEALKPSKLKLHLSRQHRDKVNAGVEYFKILKENFLSRSFTPEVTAAPAIIALNPVDGLIASYEISLLIAKKGYSHNIGEDLLLPSIKVAIEKFTQSQSDAVLEMIPLNSSVVSDRIAEMANDVQNKVNSELRESKFSMQLEEATFGSLHILICFARFYSPSKSSLIDEFLFAKLLKDDCNGETIFKYVSNYFEMFTISFDKVTAISLCSTPTINGKYKDFLTLIEEQHPFINTQNLANIKMPEWVMSPFNAEIDVNDDNLDLQEEIIQIKMDLEAKSLHEKESFNQFWTNKYIAQNYPKLYETVEPILLIFPNLYIVESGFNHVKNILNKRNLLHLENSGDLTLSLTNFEPNISFLVNQSNCLKNENEPF